jgi:Spy/CpxP family protein refolding chaperone
MQTWNVARKEGTMNRWLSAVPAVLLCVGPASAQEAHSPYAHAGSAEVKTLSQAEVDELLDGAGMGLARPAELNRYPGPRHALELADALALTADQRAETERVFDEMSERAKALGREIVDAEKTLDAAFAAGDVTEVSLAESVERIAGLQAELRIAHLRAHLAMREILTAHQVHEYDRLRGYAAGHDPAGG